MSCRWIWAFLGFSLVAEPAWGQFGCSASAGSPVTLRYEGLGERVADITLTCSGAAGSQGINGTIIASFELNVTSHAMVADQTGKTADAIALFDNGVNSPQLGFNAFLANRPDNNTLRWVNVPIAPPNFSGTRTIQLRNIRLGASNAGTPPGAVTRVQANVSISATPGVQVQNPNLILGYINATPGGGAIRPSSFRLGGDAFTPGPIAQRKVTLTFQEFFGSAFRIQEDPSQDGNPNQFFPGSESGYVNTSFLSSEIGSADNASRFGVRFANVPAGVQIFASTGPKQATAGIGAQLFSTDQNGAGGGPAQGSPMFDGDYSPVNISGGSGIAVWQVSGADPNNLDQITFQVVILGAPAGLGSMSITGGLAPFSNTSVSALNAVVPRFVDNKVVPYVDLSSSGTLMTGGPVGLAPAHAPVVTSGSNITLAQTITSFGPVDSGNATAGGNLPAGLTIVNCTASGGATCDAQASSYTVNYANLRPGESTTVTITARVDPNLPDGTTLPVQFTIASGTPESFSSDNLSTLSLRVQKPACTFSLDKGAVSVAGYGEIGRVNVITPAGCPWTAASPVPWITIPAGTPGTGPAPFQFNVASNSATAPRSATLMVNNTIPFTVTQEASGCTFSLDPPSFTIPQTGGAFSVNVGTQAGCVWTPTGAPAFALVPNTGGTGPGTLNFTVLANNSGAARTAAITVGGQTTRLIQQTTPQNGPFTDVPPNHPYFDFINLLKSNAITQGCSPTTYCPDATTTRGQMAVFIIRSVSGGDTFTFTATPYFTDVPTGHPYFKYIQKMRDLGITVGCSATTYCPDDPVTRGQMAVFLIRGRLGITSAQNFPFNPAAFFSDVPTNHPYFSFIQAMRELAITVGCSATTYCPDSPTTRGQMAVFIIRSFFTP